MVIIIIHSPSQQQQRVITSAATCKRLPNKWQLYTPGSCLARVTNTTFSGEVSETNNDGQFYLNTSTCIATLSMNHIPDVMGLILEV